MPETKAGFGRQPVVVFGGLATSIALGVFAQSYLASELGTGPRADVFYLGTSVPTLIATATLGSSSNALIGYATQSPEVLDPRVRRSAGFWLCCLSIVLSVSVLLAGVGTAAGVLPIGAAESRTDLGHFLLIVSPVPTLIAFAAIGGVMALAEQRFFRAAWGGAANGAGMLVALVAFSFVRLDAVTLAASVVLGYVAQLTFVIPSYSLLRSLRQNRTAAGSLDAAGAWSATLGLLVLICASFITKSQPLVERTVGAAVGQGVPAALGYTDKVTMALSQAAAFGFAMASLPGVSRDIAASNLSSATARVRASLAGTVVTVTIVIAFAITSSDQVVRVLYERGSFSADATRLTQTLVLFALPSVALGAICGPIVSVAYAAKSIGHVVRIGLVGFLAGTTATMGLAYVIGEKGIVLGTATGFAVTFVLFATRLREFLPDWSWREFVSTHGARWLAVVAAVGCAGLVVAVTPVPASTAPALLVLGLRMSAIAAVGIGVWIIVSRRTTS